MLFRVHEAETFNAQQIDLAFGIDSVFGKGLPFISRLNAKKANRFAENIIYENQNMYKHIKGVKGTDAHGLLEQVGTTGVFIPKDGLVNFEWFMHHMTEEKDFIAAPDQHVSRGSFIMGMLGAMLE